MDTWLSSLLAAFARNLVCGAVDQLRYPCCFNDFVEDLQGNEDKLITTRKSVDDYVKHAKKHAMKNADVFHAWLEQEANPLKNNVEGLLKQARTNRTCCFGHCPNWIWRYQLAKKLAEKKVEVEKCIEIGSRYIRLERAASLASMQHLPSEKCLKFDSRQYAYEQLMEALKDDEVYMIGLYGMGGCGKTTMAMELMRTAEAEHLFDKLVFVPVSSKLEVQQIQNKIASALQFQFPEDEERERAQRLHTRLTIDEERTLVILDDVWQLLDFGDIGIPSGENHRSCKVLITTRSEAVCTLMDCQKMIHLSTLTNEEAWDLFQKQAHISKGTSNTLKHLGRLISNECKGLPVAIAALASTLKGKAEDDWQVALHRLANSIPVNIEKGLQNPYNCLQISYDNLDTEEAKSLFLLCSVFPEDYEIPVENLIRFAIGLGLVGKFQSFEGARNEVSAAKNKLISSCLLSDANDGEGVKMHDLVRSVALWVAKNENKMVKCALEKDVTLECSSIRYLWCKELPNELDCSNIEFLCIKTDLDLSDEIFKGMGRLRVLFLCWEGHGSGSLLTISFKSLTNLHCLFLDGWELGNISFVGYMTKLESFTLLHCSFFGLLDVVITQLTNLRLLHLSECDMKMNSFEVVGRHPQVEELYFYDVGSNVIFERDFDNGDHVEFFKKSNTPHALQRYLIKLGPKFEYCEEEVLNSHRTLILSCLDTSNAIVMDLAKKAEVLLLANIKGSGKNVIPNLFQIEKGGVMNHGWIQLWLCDSKEIECLIDTNNYSEDGRTPLSELRMLRIERMEHFGALYHGVLPSGLFEKLEQLYINECPMLTCLFTPAIAQSLVQLEKLEILSCDELKYILADDDAEDKEISRQDQRLVFSKLKQLRIIGCLMLEYIIPVTFAQGLLQLESLDIRYCWELKYVFKQSILGQNELKIELPALKNLQFTFNSNMISIFPQYCFALWPYLHRFHLEYCPLFDIMYTFKASSWKDVRAIEKHFLTSETLCIDHKFKAESVFNLDGLEIIGQPVSLRLQYLKLSYLYEMKYICVGSKNSFTFQNLKTLQISECGRLEVVFPASVLRCLPELEHLTIVHCHELKQIVKEDVEKQELSNIAYPQPCFPKLATLVVKDCNNLKRLFYASNDLPNLELLMIEGASELEELIGYEQGQGDEIIMAKVELPKLKLIVLMNLTSLCQGIELPTPTVRVVHDCPRLSLTSSFAMHEEVKGKLSELGIDGLFDDPLGYILNVVHQAIESCQDFIPEDARVENRCESVIQKLLGETRSIIEISQSIEGTEMTTIREVPTSMEPAIPTLATPLHKITSSSIEDKIKENVQEGSISEDTTKAAMPTGIEGNALGVIVMMHTEAGTSQCENMQNVGDSVQERPKSMDKEGEIEVVSNGSIDVHSTCVDTCSRHSLLVAELGASKHFVDLDDAQIVLLAEAIIMYPHLRKVLDKFSMRFQAWMLKTLADMLFFLRNESAASVTPQREKQFQIICDEAVQLGFDKSWVNEMRQRVTVKDLRVDHAYARLNELLKRHDHLTQELCKIKDEIDSLHDFVDSQKKCFDFL